MFLCKKGKPKKRQLAKNVFLRKSEKTWVFGDVYGSENRQASEEKMPFVVVRLIRNKFNHLNVKSIKKLTSYSYESLNAIRL